MTVRSELCTEVRAFIRWVLRRPEPPPPPGTGQAIQAAEQAAARGRILAQAEAERTPLDDTTQVGPVPRGGESR
ncbi:MULTISPECIES: hypothetical protein [Micromonospora]|uniref:Uncharacterized protein n=1 Tax=Micromonospora yangpuensis TaxID=683228 RepID=A0A1C6UF19_9ACTN|nr:hypothetical protein [Micromonospora yangpuensis]GGM06146.1 hypothetical protein GCM10012279_24920 [Micromonospora yangpuensis]SCL52541.1 hypothetical protein GA0070617_2106 [Micromonospora yangpuensis]